MRIWDFKDNRVAPDNVVLEQDFILKIRRLYRTDTPYLIANILLSEIPSDYAGRGTLEKVQQRLQELAQAQRGTYAEMSNGDVFLIWPTGSMSHLFPDQALTVTLPEGTNDQDKERYIHLYNLPGDYAQVRERISHYIEETRTFKADEDTPIKLLQSDAARGPLTAWSLQQIERLLKEIELYTFIRSQTAYQLTPDNSWGPIFDETFMGLGEIKQAYFPHCEIKEPKHLFLDLCRILDDNLLSTVATNYETGAARNMNLNLSPHTVLESNFSQFSHHIPHAERGNICFEIHVGDILQDFTLTLNSLETLRQEKYRIAIDGISPDMLGYIHFARFNPDYIKINVSKDYLDMLCRPSTKQAIADLPRDKIVFFNCDSERGLREGQELGITRFQGWYIDERTKA